MESQVVCQSKTQAKIFPIELPPRFLLWHMAALTLSFLACITGVISAGLSDADWLANNVPADSVLNDYDVQGGDSIMKSPLGGESCHQVVR